MRFIGNGFFIGPPRDVYASTKIDECGLWNMDRERADGRSFGSSLCGNAVTGEKN